MTKSQNTKNEQQSTSEQLKEEYEKECKRADELEDSYWKEVEKNKKLKELLKEVNDYLPEFEIPMSILAKIDEVLK